MNRAANEDNELDLSPDDERDKIIDHPNNISNSNNIDEIISLNNTDRKNNIICNFNNRIIPGRMQKNDNDLAKSGRSLLEIGNRSDNSKLKENARITQEKRVHDTIPGWNGAKYEKRRRRKR